MSLAKPSADDKISTYSTGLDTNITEKNVHARVSSDVSETADKISTVKEKVTVSSSSDLGEDNVELLSEEFANIPELVRNTVSFEDDPTLPVITFRSVLLSVFFCVLGSFVSQLSFFRTVRIWNGILRGQP